MFSDIFYCIFDSADAIDFEAFMICLISAMAVGLFIAFINSRCYNFTKSFLITLALLPPVVTMVIMMVNGNIGTGIAVAGAFSLVRFRSVPGSAKEIGTIFIAMASGLTLGMGYVGFAVAFVVVVCAFDLLLTKTEIFKNKFSKKILSITIPESLNYDNAFKDLFAKYTTQNKLMQVKSTNMGSMFKLKYDVSIKTAVSEKQFIDEIRCRNGNLEVFIMDPACNAGDSL